MEIEIREGFVLAAKYLDEASNDSQCEEIEKLFDEIEDKEKSLRLSDEVGEIYQERIEKAYINGLRDGIDLILKINKAAS